MRELRISHARVSRAANTRNNPLPRVSTQVQHEVADAVRLLVRSPPDLFVTQTLETAFDFRQILLDEKLARAGKKSFWCSGDWSGHLLSPKGNTLNPDEPLTPHSSSVTSGRCLCFALRCAGRATSSGFARDRGCPGGATGLRMLSNTGRACTLFPFGGELRLAIIEPPLRFLAELARC